MDFEISKAFRLAYILDDHSLFAEMQEKSLSDYDLFESTYVFSDEKKLLSHLLHNETSKTIYFFLDYYLQNSTIPPVIAQIRRLVKDPKIIIISGITNPILLSHLQQIKVDGIVHKSDRTRVFVHCVKEIFEGRTYLSETISDMIKKSQNQEVPFTSRELELITYFSKGYTVEETGDLLGISPHTVTAHRRKMFLKIQCNNVSELLAYARKLELI
jgi:DNA-binding NarL/FixJ family response regulator